MDLKALDKLALFGLTTIISIFITTTGLLVLVGTASSGDREVDFPVGVILLFLVVAIWLGTVLALILARTLPFLDEELEEEN